MRKPSDFIWLPELKANAQALYFELHLYWIDRLVKVLTKIAEKKQSEDPYAPE